MPAAPVTEVAAPSQAEEATQDPHSDGKAASGTSPSPPSAPGTDIVALAASGTASESTSSPANAELPSRAMPAAPVTDVAAPSQPEEATQDPHSEGKAASGTSPPPPTASGTTVAAPAASATVSEANGSPANSDATSAASSAPSVQGAAPSTGEPATRDRHADARAAIETAIPAPNSPATQVVLPAPDDNCKRDADRLQRLRSNPSGVEAQRFASEIGCERLRPQLLRLMESLGYSEPTSAAPTPSPASRSLSADQAANDCAAERDRLDSLRAQPSAEAAQQFWRTLRCERLRPQVRLLLESLDLAADPSGACRREAEELNRIRANPNDEEAELFARNLTCDALKPQAARLLESLTE